MDNLLSVLIVGTAIIGIAVGAIGGFRSATFKAQITGLKGLLEIQDRKTKELEEKNTKLIEQIGDLKKAVEVLTDLANSGSKIDALAKSVESMIAVEHSDSNEIRVLLLRLLEDLAKHHTQAMEVWERIRSGGFASGS